MAEQYLDMNDFHNMPGIDRLRFIYYAVQMGNNSKLRKDEILELLEWMVSRFVRVKEVEDETDELFVEARTFVHIDGASLDLLTRQANAAEKEAAKAQRKRIRAAEKLAAQEQAAAEQLHQERVLSKTAREAQEREARKKEREEAEKRRRLEELREAYSAEHFTDDELWEMENTYLALADEYKGSITPRLQMALRDLAKMRMLRDRCIAAGEEQAAAKYQGMYDKIMAGEALKVGDSKPLKNMRIDALADALERAGCLGTGQLLDKGGVIRYIRGNHGDYDMSLDVVDEIMLLMENTRRRNAGEAELNALPVGLQVRDEFRELKRKQTDFEKQTMADLGLIAPERETEDEPHADGAQEIFQD